MTPACRQQTIEWWQQRPLGRRRAGLDVWQRKGGVLGSSAYLHLEWDQPSLCACFDVPNTSLGAKHRDGPCQMCWHGGTVRDLLLIPYVDGITQLLPRQPKQEDSPVCRAPQNPAHSRQGLVRSIPTDSVEMGDRGGRASSQPGPSLRLTEHIKRTGGAVAALAPLTPSSKQQQGAGILQDVRCCCSL